MLLSWSWVWVLTDPGWWSVLWLTVSSMGLDIIAWCVSVVRGSTYVRSWYSAVALCGGVLVSGVWRETKFRKPFLVTRFWTEIRHLIEYSNRSYFPTASVKSIKLDSSGTGIEIVVSENSKIYAAQPSLRAILNLFVDILPTCGRLQRQNSVFLEPVANLSFISISLSLDAIQACVCNGCLLTRHAPSWVKHCTLFHLKIALMNKFDWMRAADDYKHLWNKWWRIGRLQKLIWELLEVVTWKRTYSVKKEIALEFIQI